MELQYFIWNQQKDLVLSFHIESTILDLAFNS